MAPAYAGKHCPQGCFLLDGWVLHCGLFSPAVVLYLLTREVTARAHAEDARRISEA